MTIFLDMDGVLCEFVRGVCDLLGEDFDSVMRRWPPGSYDMTDAFGMPQDDLFSMVRMAGVDFWTKLPSTPWETQLWNLAVDFSNENKLDRIAIATSHLSPQSAIGKQQWIDSRWGGDVDAVFLRRKYLLARPGAILIDDWDWQCDSFAAAGGHAILFPRPWNSNHEMASDPLPYVRDRLEGIIRPIAATP